LDVAREIHASGDLARGRPGNEFREEQRDEKPGALHPLGRSALATSAASRIVTSVGIGSDTIDPLLLARGLKPEAWARGPMP
jgi:hypothetical protein